MDNKIEVLREEIRQKLANAKDLSELDKARVEYLGKKGSITALLKGMKNLSNDEKKTFGAEVNKLKAAAAKRIEERVEELKKLQIEAEINAMPKFDITAPADLTRGSYHPITLVQRQCETIFKLRITPRLLPTTSALSRLIFPSTTLRAICRTHITSRTASS